MKKYVALLRGINVGGHKIVPMKELKILLEEKGYSKVKTLLASGNVIFESQEGILSDFQGIIENHFGFSIPTVIFPHDFFISLVESDPFEGIEVHKKIRLYISFLHDETKSILQIPYESEDGSFRIIKVKDRLIYSVLDLSVNKTPKAMEIIEKEFSKNLTTRNYNTVVKIANV